MPRDLGHSQFNWGVCVQQQRVLGLFLFFCIDKMSILTLEIPCLLVSTYLNAQLNC